MNNKRALTRIQAVIIIVIVIIAIIGVSAYILTSSNHSTSTLTTSSTTTSQQQILTVYVAGAYTAIFNNLASQFQNATGIPVKIVPGGSFGLAGQIASLTPVPASAFFPVAYIQAVELEGSRNAGWAIAFLSDQITIVYSNYTTKSPYWNQLYSNYTMAMKTNESKYWYNFFSLLVTKFSIGISNPSTDPEGLYGMLILKMAGYLYANHNESYFIDLLNKNPGYKVSPTTEAYVAPLKAGTLDFAISYVSYAISQNLEYLKLPPWFSFAYYPNETKWYSQFSYNITVNGKTLTISGNPIYLYATVPLGAPNPQAAYEFIQFIVTHVSELAKYGVTPLKPALLFYNNASNVPAPIMNLLNSGELKYAGNFSSV
ncbi:MAG: extracellular solute-binding protein [Saccharolobus sp.]